MKKDKKPFKERARDWWDEHDEQVISGAIFIGVTVAGIFAMKKAGEHALDKYNERLITDLSDLTDTDLNSLTGTVSEKTDFLTEKLWEEKDLETFDNEITDAIQDLHDKCKDKGIEISLGAMLGTDTSEPDYFEIEHYTKHGANIDRDF